jgi:hypothetical protein
MSKMSQLHAELSEQAADLGFGSIEEAEAHGYIVDYNKGTLTMPEDPVAQLSLAHEAWERKRDYLADSLDDLLEYLRSRGDVPDHYLIKAQGAVTFIRGCRDGC